MNQNRTFGVEIEMSSDLSRHQLAEKLNLHFEAIRSFHRVAVIGFGRNNDPGNFRLWYIKTDSTIQPRSQKFHYPMEIASPVLKGTDGLDALKEVCDTIHEHAHVNSSMGLHIHHGITPREATKLGHLINAWLKAEQHILYCLPPSRRNNYQYCAPWGRKPKTNAKTINQARNWYRRNVGTRYTTLNFESYWLRGTVEFRCHSATYEFEKMKNWLIATQAFLDKALQGSYDTTEVQNLDDVIAVIKNNETVVNTFRGSVRVVRGQVTRTWATECYLREHTGQWVFLSDLIEHVCAVREESVSTIEPYVRGLVRNWRKKGLVSENQYAQVKWEPILPVRNEADQDVIEACNWLQTRKQHFAEREGRQT